MTYFESCEMLSTFASIEPTAATSRSVSLNRNPAHWRQKWQARVPKPHTIERPTGTEAESAVRDLNPVLPEPDRLEYMAIGSWTPIFSKIL